MLAIFLTEVQQQLKMHCTPDMRDICTNLFIRISFDTHFLSQFYTDGIEILAIKTTDVNILKMETELRQLVILKSHCLQFEYNFFKKLWQQKFPNFASRRTNIIIKFSNNSFRTLNNTNLIFLVDSKKTNYIHVKLKR